MFLRTLLGIMFLVVSVSAQTVSGGLQIGGGISSGIPSGGTYDMLSLMLLSPSLRAADHMAGTKLNLSASNHIYNQLLTGDYYATKGDSPACPWDINTFDANYIYLSTTELTYASCSEGKRFESLNPSIGFKGVPYAKRYMNIGDSVYSSDSRFAIYTACGTATYANIGYVKVTLTGPYVETIPGAGSNLPPNLHTVHLEYEWDLAAGYTHQAASVKETNTFDTSGTYGWVAWTTQDWNTGTGAYDPPTDAAYFNILTAGTTGIPYSDPCGFGMAGVGSSSVATIPPPIVAPFSGRTGAGTVVLNPEPSNYSTYGAFGLNNPMAEVSDSNSSSNLCVAQGDATGCPLQANYSEFIDPGDGEDRNWSNDESQFLTYNAGAAVHIWNFNTSTMIATPCFTQRTAAGNLVPWFGGAIYSGLTAKKVYSFSNPAGTAVGTVMSSYPTTGSCPLSLSGKGPTVYDFASSANGVPSSYVNLCEAPVVNNADTIFGGCFSNSGTQNTAIYVAFYKVGSGITAWNTSTGAITADWGSTGAAVCQNCPGHPISPGQFTIHNLKIDPTGTWAVVTPATCTSTCFYGAGEYIWQIGTLNVYEMVGGNSGHWVAGYTGIVNEDNTPYHDWRTWGSSTFSTFPAATTYCGSNPPSVALDDHPSWWWNSGADQEPFLVSTSSGSSNAVYSGCGVDEIMLMYSPANIANSGRLIRIAHNYAAPVEFQGEYALAEISPLGHFALFTSPMANSSTGMGQLGDTSGNATCTVIANCASQVFVVRIQ